MENLGSVLRRFPLVARPRPPCLPLAERIEHQLTEPAQAALREPDPTRALALAASVQNQAALLASDCDLPGLARQLCWQQFDAFQAGWPLTAPAARHCLEPLVNLARLQIRAGQGQGAHHLLESLYRAVTIGEDATIDGRRLAFDRLVDTGDDHRAVSQWLWTVVLADGTRALASEGRWQDAAAHADRHGGIGRRLLDGRQAAILAYWADDDPASASALLDATEPTEHWEHAVTTCLAVLCAVDAATRTRAVQAMTARYLNLASEPQLRPFRVRLGLATLGLANQTGKAERDAIAQRIIDETITSADGRLAGDVLSTGGTRAELTPAKKDTLTRLHAAAALEPHRLAASALAEVHTTIESSIDLIRRRIHESVWDSYPKSGPPGRLTRQGAGRGVVVHRKAPCWRVRLRSGRHVELAGTSTAVAAILDELTSGARHAGWRRTLYEPETLAFGGPPGIDIAHDLLCADSSHILAYLRQPEPVVGRRELSVLLCTALFRAAAQEWFESGDIWHRVMQMRPTPGDVPADPTTELRDDLRRLLGCDARSTGALFGTNGPLAFAEAWAAAFDRAGHPLATAANDGMLQRGTRDILAHHVIFHWNRMGLPATTQAILAHAAKTSIVA